MRSSIEVSSNNIQNDQVSYFVRVCLRVDSLTILPGGQLDRAPPDDLLMASESTRTLSD